MNITLCNSSSERNEVNKSISGGVTFDCTLRAETSISDPSILLEFNGNLSQYNYCYIPDFQRYYYITDITSVRNNLWQVSCHVDVLMSFKNAILSSIAIIEETSVAGISNYLSNDVWVALSKDKTSIIPFASGLNSSGQYILITAGG